MKQTGYLFSAGVTSTRMVSSPSVRGGKSFQTWDSCVSAIVYGADLVRAQEVFENWCQPHESAGDEPAQDEIKKLVAAEIIQQLLTESGSEELDWAAIEGKVLQSIPNVETPGAPDAAEAAPPDLTDGYWVEINQVIGPSCAQQDMESLKRDLPEDIRSGLNWRPERKFIFLVSSLSPRSIVADPTQELPGPDLDSEESTEPEQAQTDSPLPLEENVAYLPEMREKEAAALIEARNSIVAAWLWWRYAANTRLASNEVLVSPCCQLIPAE